MFSWNNAKKETSMQFYTKNHQYYCGIDLHARTMYICILNQAGDVLVHRNCQSNADRFLSIIAPYRDDIVVSVECIFTWYWLADLCAQENIAFVLGHALYMKAIHGGKAKNDKLDSHKIALLLKGGMLPQAYAYPAAMRATRDLCRRRMHLARQRADLMAHIQNTVHQYNRPSLGISLGKANRRQDVAKHFPHSVVQQMVQLDLDLINVYDEQLGRLQRDLVKQAKKHDQRMYALLTSMRGIGPILALVILYEIQDIQRFPTSGQFLSYARLVRCAKESAGKKVGKSNKKIGNSYLRWAFGEAAVLFLKGNDPAYQWYLKKSSTHGKGKALAILAKRLGETAYAMLSKNQFFDEEKFMSHLR
jgi:transposase